MGVLLDSLHSALALGPVAQDHLLQARQMPALSFTAHIPLVCFGIAFPMMVLLMEWWGQRTGDPLCRTIARRWSRVMTERGGDRLHGAARREASASTGARLLGPRWADGAIRLSSGSPHVPRSVTEPTIVRAVRARADREPRCADSASQSDRRWERTPLT